MDMTVLLWNLGVAVLRSAGDNTMTATIIPFPTLEERDALEFARFGTSSYTRALDEAAALLPALWSSNDRTSLAGRVDTFARQLARLASGRPEMVEEFVVLDGGWLIELRAVPPMLAAMLAAA